MCSGWALPRFQAKNQDVVVPLSVHTMQKCNAVFATLMGFSRIWGLASPPNPSEINQNGNSDCSSFTSSVKTKGNKPWS